MATAAWVATVKISGAATTMTTEACTGATTAWRITSLAKRVIDPLTALLWYDNAVLISGADIVSVDYMTGRIVFTAGKTGPITVSGKYIPLLTYASARAADVKVETNPLDTSVFGSQYNSFVQGLKKVSGTIESLGLLGDDLDPGAGTVKLATIAEAGTNVVLQVSPDGGTTLYSFWAKIFTTNQGAKVADLVVTSCDFMSTTITAVDGTLVNVSLGA